MAPASDADSPLRRVDRNNRVRCVFLKLQPPPSSLCRLQQLTPVGMASRRLVCPVRRGHPSSWTHCTVYIIREVNSPMGPRIGRAVAAPVVHPLSQARPDTPRRAGPGRGRLEPREATCELYTLRWVGARVTVTATVGLS